MSWDVFLGEDKVRPRVSHQEAQEELLEVELLEDWESGSCWCIHETIRYHVWISFRFVEEVK